MLKRFFTTLIVAVLVGGAYFYFLQNNSQSELAINADPAVPMVTATKVDALQTAAGGEPSANVEFTLTDQNNKTVTDKDLRGKKLLVFFGFTSCPDICPVSMAVMSEVMNQLESVKITNIQPVFVSVDPKTDTPATLKTFLKDYHPGFIALTGDQAELDKVAKSFKAYAKPPADQDDMAEHSGMIYYMAEDGKYISHFTGDSSPEDIVDYISSH